MKNRSTLIEKAAPPGRLRSRRNFLNRLAACGQGPGENAFETVFVDHCRDGLLAFFVERADHASCAIHLDVSVSPQNGSGQNDAETDHCADAERIFGMEKHAAGGNVRGFSEVFVRIRCAYGNRKSKWKTYRASGICRAQARDWSLDFVHPCTSACEVTPPAQPSQDYFGIPSAPKDMRRKRWPNIRSKLGYFSEVKTANFHGRDHHIERLFSAGAHRSAHGLNVVEHFNQALVKAEIQQPVLHFSIFHQEGAVTRHAGKDFFVGINFADVPQPRDQNAALGSGNHLADRLLIAGRDKNYIDGSL